MKLNNIRNRIAEAIELDKAAEKAVGISEKARADAEKAFVIAAETAATAAEACKKAAAACRTAKAASREAEGVLRTCAEIAIGDRLGGFVKAPEEIEDRR